MRKHRVPLIGSAACILMALGCVVSDNPWYTDKDLVFDPGLVGNWVGGDDGKLNLVKGTGDSYVIKDDDESIPAHLLKVGSTHYFDLHFKGKEKSKETSGHMLVKLSRDGDKLTMTHMDPEFVAKGIEAKTLPVTGTVERKDKKNPPKVHLTGPTTELRALLDKHGEALFKEGKVMRFKRKGT